MKRIGAMSEVELRFSDVDSITNWKVNGLSKERTNGNHRPDGRKERKRRLVDRNSAVGRKFA